MSGKETILFNQCVFYQIKCCFIVQLVKGIIQSCTCKAERKFNKIFLHL